MVVNPHCHYKDSVTYNVAFKTPLILMSFSAYQRQHFCASSFWANLSAGEQIKEAPVKDSARAFMATKWLILRVAGSKTVNCASLFNCKIYGKWIVMLPLL